MSTKSARLFALSAVPPHIISTPLDVVGAPADVTLQTAWKRWSKRGCGRHRALPYAFACSTYDEVHNVGCREACLICHKIRKTSTAHTQKKHSSANLQFIWRLLCALLSEQDVTATGDLKVTRGGENEARVDVSCTQSGCVSVLAVWVLCSQFPDKPPASAHPPQIDWGSCM